VLPTTNVAASQVNSPPVPEIATPVKGVNVVVITAPDREANADFLKKVYSQVDSM
jgi:hypothetical protein